MEKKRRIVKVKEDSDYNEVFRDFREIVRNYKKYTTKKEWTITLVIPILLSSFIFLLIGIIEDYNVNILNEIMEINSISLSIMAILAGFNTTSLAIITASNYKIIRLLKNSSLKKEGNSGDSILKQLISFFSFAIVYQLTILIVGILITMFSRNLVDISSMVNLFTGLWVRIPLILIGIVWMSAILFALVISLRNATLLYRYVLFLGSYTEDTQNKTEDNKE